MDIIVNQKDSGSSAVNEGTTKQVASLEGRSASLGNHRDSVFTDVTSGKGSSSNTIYCTSYKGILHSFNSARQMEKWVDLRSPIFALAATERFVACACADGNVRLFQPISLQYIGTLPKPHPIGTDLLASNSEQTPQPIQPQPSATKYPDVIACRLSAESGKILCCYSDHSIFVWGVEDISKVYKYRSFLAHSSCIWYLYMVIFLIFQGCVCNLSIRSSRKLRSSSSRYLYHMLK